LATLAELANGAAARQAVAEELSAARRCQPVLLAAATAQQAEAELANATRAERQALAALGDLPEATADVAELRTQAGALREEAGSLRQLVAEAEAQRTDQAHLTELTQRHKQTDARAADLAERLATLPQRLTAAHADRDAAMSATARLDGLQAQVIDLRALHTDALRLPEAEKAAATSQAASLAAIDAHQQAREALLDARQRRLDGMAAELAGALITDQPCPVCGSDDHPAPAVTSPKPVNEADERAAAEAEQTANTERERTNLAAAETRHRLDALIERLAGRTANDLAEALHTVESELAQASERAAGETASTDLVSRLETEAADLRTEQVEAERSRAAIATEQAGLA
jgi:exonuclease SbcC